MTEYRPADAVRWAVEPAGILLLHTAAGTSRFLGYPQAAAWDLIARGDSIERVAAKLCPIASLEPAEVETMLVEFTASLLAEGYLKMGERSG